VKKKQIERDKVVAIKEILDRRKAAEGQAKKQPQKETKQPKQATTFTLRERLKAIVEQQVEQLPETLESMDAEDRAAFLLKVMPYVMPKVKSLSPTYDAPVAKDSWWD
jgi:hypothetical protein